LAGIKSIGSAGMATYLPGVFFISLGITFNMASCAQRRLLY